MLHSGQRSSLTPSLDGGSPQLPIGNRMPSFSFPSPSSHGAITPPHREQHQQDPSRSSETQGSAHPRGAARGVPVSAAAHNSHHRSRSAQVRQQRCGINGLSSTRRSGSHCYNGRAISPLPLVASEIIVNEKVLVTPAPVRALAVSRHLVWMSFSDGGCEIRNARTAEVVHRFSSRSSSSKATDNANEVKRLGAKVSISEPANPARAPPVVIQAMLSVVTRAGEPQMWLGLSDGSIEVHHGESAELIAALNKHLGAVTALAEFGGLVYSGGKDQQVAQWQLEGCRYVRAFMGAHGHSGEILCMYAEGNALVTGAADDTVKVWDVGTGDMQLTGYFHAHSGGVTALCQVAQTMWSGDHAGQVVRWDLVTGEALATMRPHSARVTAMKRAGTRVYTGSADGTLAILCAETSQLLKRIEDQSGGWLTALVCPLQLSRFVVWSADAQGTVRCWYHDELTYHSRDFEQLSDEAAWYRSGATPYGDFRRSIAARNAQLREQLAAAERRDPRAVTILRQCTDAGGVGAAGRDAARQLGRLQDQMRVVEDRRSRVSQDLQTSKDALAQVERDVATTLALLQATQSDLNALSAGYGDRLAATLPPVSMAGAGAQGTEAAAAATPGVALTGLPGVAAAAPPTAASLPTNPMLVPPPLTAATGASSLLPPPPPAGAASVVPLAPLATSIAAPGGLGVTGTAGSMLSHGGPMPLTTAPGGAAESGALPTATAAGGMPAAPLGLGAGSPPPQPQLESGAATTLAPGPAVPGMPTSTKLMSLSYEEQVRALLAAVESDGRKASTAGGGAETHADAVAWVNPNVGNYIQRRYYGAVPSLRAPDLEKREKRRGRTPVVKVVPLKRTASVHLAAAEAKK